MFRVTKKKYHYLTKSLIVFFNVILYLISDVSIIFAEIKNFQYKSEYIMKDSEPIKRAQEIAFNMALRNISEQAGIYIDSSSNSEFGKLTKDEIESITAAIVKVKSKKYSKEITSDGKLKIFADVIAEVDIDKAEQLLNDLAKAHKSSKSYEQVLKEFNDNRGQYSELYNRYIVFVKKAAMRKVREGCHLMNEGKIDEAIECFNDAILKNSDIGRAYIKRGHIYILQGKFDLAQSDFEKALQLNNDDMGIHYVKAVMAERQKNKLQAINEYREFIKLADIVYYDVEITEALDKIIELDPDGVD